MGREGHQHILHHHDGLLQLEGCQQFLRYQDGLLQLEGRRWIPAKGAWGHGIQAQGQDELPADAILSGEPTRLSLSPRLSNRVLLSVFVISLPP